MPDAVGWDHDRRHVAPMTRGSTLGPVLWLILIDWLSHFHWSPRDPAVVTWQTYALKWDREIYSLWKTKQKKEKNKIIEGDGKKEAGKIIIIKKSKEGKNPGIRENTDAHWKASQGYHHGDKSTTDTSRCNPLVGGSQGSGLSSEIDKHRNARQLHSWKLLTLPLHVCSLCQELIYCLPRSFDHQLRIHFE